MVRLGVWVVEVWQFLPAKSDGRCAWAVVVALFSATVPRCRRSAGDVFDDEQEVGVTMLTIVRAALPGRTARVAAATSVPPECATAVLTLLPLIVQYDNL